MKKIVTISLIIQIIIVLIWFVYFFYKKESKAIENNIVQIIKKEEISKIDANPWWIFDSNYNLEKNIFSWFFINKNTILTVAHWVNSKNSIYKIKNIYWNTYNWLLKNKIKEQDYAILKTNKNFKKFTNYKISDNYKVWDIVYSLSYNHNENKLKKIKWQIKNINKTTINTDIKFINWDSWWILIDDKNNIIWLNNWFDLDDNYSISTGIKDIIENNQ